MVHLQPMKWENGWPVIGVDEDGDGTGSPVSHFKKPGVGKTWQAATPEESDEFSGFSPGPQWQWNANPDPTWAVPFPGESFLRLYSVPLPEPFRNFYLDVPNTLLQKFPAPAFTATARVTFKSRFQGETAGLVIMGRDYSYLGLKDSARIVRIAQTICREADEGLPETEMKEVHYTDSTCLYLRVSVSDTALCRFSYSVDNLHYHDVGTLFKAREGGWIGAKVGLFMVRTGKVNDAGSMDVDWFRVE